MKKGLPENIKKAFRDLDFTDNQIIAGVWWLKRGGMEVCIASHQFLEQVANKMQVEFLPKPEKLYANGEGKSLSVAMLVYGKYKDKAIWTTGESNPSNTKNDYPWAMAEKRGKDRIVIKFLNLEDLLYSDTEEYNIKTSTKDSPEPVKSDFKKTKKLEEKPTDKLGW